MATVNKNFRVKNGLIVEGGSATVNGFDVLTKAQADQDYIVGIIGGTATSANTANTVVKRDANGNFAAGTITATFTGNLTGNVTGNLTGDVTGNVSGSAGTVTSLSGHSSDEISEGSTNKYYTDERAQDAVGNSLGTGLSYNDTTGAISVTTNTYDAYGAASAAQSAAATDATSKANAAQAAAISAAATDATSKANAAQAAAEATAATALTAVKNGTTKFTAVNVNDLVSQRAAQAVLASIATGSSVMSWAKSDYPTAKLWVKFATATHSQISEILLTTDSSNNIAITDFAETGTNGSLGTITASYVAGNIGIEVNTVYANTTVTVVATLIK